MPSKEIYELINQTVGLDITSVGEETIRRAVSMRMDILGCDSPTDYLEMLKGSFAERQNLVNDITVPETWFFRDSLPFELLAEYVTRMWEPQYLGQKLHILSVPCATGEEPYSIAMTLFDAGLSAEDFVLDAADVSTRVLELAELGTYGRNSFRGDNMAFRDQYFEEEKGLFKIREDIKSAVSFYHQNVLAHDFMEGRGPYNIVFCRNLLIYFDLPTKRQVLKKLSRLMLTDALLFLGHAETGRMDSNMFVSLRRSGTFAYRKVSEHEDVSSNAQTKVIQFPKPASPCDCGVELPDDLPDSLHGLSIAQLRNIVAKKDFNDSKSAIQVYISEHPDSFEAYRMLGGLYEAFDEITDAIGAYKCAVYLDPSAYRILLRLADLCELDGDTQAAKNYRARAARVKRGQSGDD